MRVGVGAAVGLTPCECPSGDALVQRDVGVDEALGAFAGEHPRPETVTFPVGLEECKTVDRHHLSESRRSDLQDSLWIVLSLERARSLDEEAREAPVIEVGDAAKGNRHELDRGPEGVAALLEDSDLPALKPCNRDDLIRGLRALGLNYERMCQMWPHPVLHPELGQRRRGLPAVD